MENNPTPLPPTFTPSPAPPPAPVPVSSPVPPSPQVFNPQAAVVPPASGQQGHKLLLGGLVTLLVVIMVGVLLLWPAHHAKQAVSGPQTTVQITSQGFEPAALKIKAGTTVTWNNTDSVLHQIDSNPYPADNGLPGLASTGLESGQSYSYTFKHAGRFGYHDQQDPTKILGVVDVSN